MLSRTTFLMHRDATLMALQRLWLALLLALAAPAWAQNNANLSALSLSAGTLSPAFAADTTGYNASVDNAVSSLTITPTAADSSAMVKVNGSTVSSGTPSGAMSLNVGSNTITVSVMAGDNFTQKTYTVTVTRMDAPLSGWVSTTSALCNGTATGTATVTPSGGSGDYSYAWSPTGGTATTAAGLTAGLYSVKITDTQTREVYTVPNISIIQPSALGSTGSSTHPSGGLANGSASVLPSGGTASYTYSWAPSGGTSATANNLAPGTYTATITDANLCTITRSFTLVDPDIPTVQSVSVPDSGTYGPGSELRFVVHYDVAVTVTGTPSLPVVIDSSGTREAMYVSGSGSDALTFTYTVQTGDVDMNGISLAGSITPNGGTLASTNGGVNASLTLNSMSSTAGVLVQAPQQSASGHGVTLGIANPAASCTLTGTPTFTLLGSLPPGPQTALPPGYSYPFAAVDFAASQCQANSNLTVTLTYPGTVPQNAQMVKWDGAAWQAFTPDRIDGHQVTYTVADNGALDTDKAAGRFADPALLAIPRAAAAAEARAVPTLGAWALALLAALLGALGVRGWRRELLFKK